jgi:radical SAM-linked protein
VRFVSHLEQIEMFRRALRRADLPLTYTAGFHPQPRIAFGPAISVGYESDSEYIEAELGRRMDTAELQTRLSSVLPSGYALAGIRNVPVFFPSLDSLTNVAAYRVAINVPQEKVEAFLAQQEIIVEKVKQDKRERIDARPLIRELSSVNGELFLQLRFGPKKNIKPEKIVQVLAGIDETQARQLRITRTALLIEKKDGTISEP